MADGEDVYWPLAIFPHWQHFLKIPRGILPLSGKITRTLYLTFRKEYIIMIAFPYQKDLCHERTVSKRSAYRAL